MTKQERKEIHKAIKIIAREFQQTADDYADLAEMWDGQREYDYPSIPEPARNALNNILKMYKEKCRQLSWAETQISWYI